MCGITGFIDCSAYRNQENMNNMIIKMTDTLLRRGPDDMGFMVDVEAGIALGHRRLSIIDLTVEGHQPMYSSGRRYVIVFNGEIYNYRSIGAELRGSGVSFRGHSDTEVLLAAVEKWGLNNTVKRLVGMFAFALWDKIEHKLFLVRDRAGEKPLYYGWMGNSFLFGSELKPLYAHPNFRMDIDRDALALYARYNYIPVPHTICRGIRKLLPGTVLTIDLNKIGAYPEPENYWALEQIISEGKLTPFKGGDNEAVEELEKVLTEAISGQMISDVPLGAFLSGGIDSSLIVAIMQSNSGQPVRTFSIGLREDAYNEAFHAAKVAKYIGSDHTELYVHPDEARGVIPLLPELYDEPFADSSQIPTFLVAKLTRKKVTVSLSGDAGDELFGGYNRYFWAKNIWNWSGWIPQRIRKGSAVLAKTLSPTQWDSCFNRISPVMPKAFQHRLPGDKIYKMADIITEKSPDAMYKKLISTWLGPEELILGSREPDGIYSQNRGGFIRDFSEQMMYYDFAAYLSNDILVKVDRACMGCSLESRVPFLDHRVIDFAWRLPLNMKIRDGKGKWLLRQLLYKYIPKEIIERPKMGFGIPIDSWLRGPLRDWCDSLLNEKRLKSEGFYHAEIVRQKWEEHLSGRRNWQYHLWNVLMFELWLGKWA